MEDKKYYLIKIDGRVQGESVLDQGAGWQLLPVNPYGNYGKWTGREWMEDVVARESDEADETLRELVRMEIEIMALERVMDKIKSL